MIKFSDKEKRIKNLCTQIEACTYCRLNSSRTNAICSEGNVKARIFFIALMPGEKQDKADKMFIGPTGKVFDELCSTIALNRSEVHRTNLLKCKLPKNRKPKQNEIETCCKYLEQEIEIIKPEFLIPLGYYATKYIINRYCSENILSSDFVGKLIYCNGQKIYPLQDPSTLLYNPSLKQTMSHDFNGISVFKKDCYE